MLQYDVAYPEHLSRGLIFIKWLLVIPHLIVLALLGIGVAVVTVIAWFAILITGSYPRGMWNFTMMVMRLSARATAYYWLQRDEYPPFGDEDYPVLFQMEYPEHLSRGLIFIKWLLVIPHLIILYVLTIVAEVVAFISWFAILFTATFPRGMFDFITGVNRWNNRVYVYLLLLTDAYPPFSLGHVGGPIPTAPVAGGSYQRNF
jgi:hypothetical protein